MAAQSFIVLVPAVLVVVAFANRSNSIPSTASPRVTAAVARRRIRPSLGRAGNRHHRRGAAVAPQNDTCRTGSCLETGTLAATEGTIMRRITTGILASIAVVGLLSACASDAKSNAGSGPANATLPGGGTVPGGGTLPPGATVPNFTLPPGVTLPTGVISLPPGLTLPTLPPGFTIPPGGTFPSNITIPTQVIDVMMAQLEAAGMKVDRPCLEALLKDPAFRSVVMTGSTPSSDMIQKLISCLRA